MAFQKSRTRARKNPARVKSQSSAEATTVEDVDMSDVKVISHADKLTLSSCYKESSAVGQTSGSKLLSNKAKCEPISSPHKVEGVNADVPGPRVIVGPHGYIILDESSLVIQRTAEPQVHESDIICDGVKRRKVQRWTTKETKKFYRALRTVQTDFTMMAQLFKYKRSRHELKLKYKLEEKRNKELVDKALDGPPVFDVDAFWNDDYESDDDVNQSQNVKISSKSTTPTDEKNAELDSSTKITLSQPQVKRKRRTQKTHIPSSSEDEDLPLKNLKDVYQVKLSPSKKLFASPEHVPSSKKDLPPEASKGIWTNRFRCRKSSVPSEYKSCALEKKVSSGNGNHPGITKLKKGCKRKPHKFVSAEFDIIKLLLGDLPKDASVNHSNIDSEIYILSESNGCEMKSKEANCTPEGNISNEIPSESDLEVVFENLNPASEWLRKRINGFPLRVPKIFSGKNHQQIPPSHKLVTRARRRADVNS